MHKLCLQCWQVNNNRMVSITGNPCTWSSWTKEKRRGNWHKCSDNLIRALIALLDSYILVHCWIPNTITVKYRRWEEIVKCKNKYHFLFQTCEAMKEHENQLLRAIWQYRRSLVKKWKWLFVGFAENLSKKLKSESDGMSKIPITEQCITDCSMLNQTTCLPASPKPATIINYHLVSFPWSWILMNCELFISVLRLHVESESRHTWDDLKGVNHIWALFRIEKAFHIKSVDILEMIWKGFVNWFLLSYL